MDWDLLGGLWIELQWGGGGWVAQVGEKAQRWGVGSEM